MKRELNIIREQIDLYKIDLSELTVITECATGAYSYNIFTLLLSGAKSVVAYGKDTRFGSFYEAKKIVEDIAKNTGINISNLEITNSLSDSQIKSADIITNSGLLRPLNSKLLSKMKKTAVIPLMWETWEFTENELDLNSAIQNDILVLGTNEGHEKLNIYPISGILAIDILLKMGLEVYKNKVIVLGSGIIGKSISKCLEKNDVEYVWFSKDKTDGSHFSYDDFLNFKKIIKYFDAIIFAEHQFAVDIIYDVFGYSFSDIHHENPEIKVGIISGNINIEELQKSNLDYFPKNIMPFGVLTHQPYNLGPRPVLELFAAGVKVGEQMARCRISGMSLEKTIKFVLKKTLAMDFVGESYMQRYKRVRFINNEKS
ncbi:hypothetical protein [Campylobacter concisus]|jgi:hypothetical protein|uniref:Uncharacterized protein n=1 Tax=Campylobacter concisus (strain 13826) TaxID=360104 RepID=A8Z6N4_CAMC1|nr:hypothetical protein [Campylobacter concisus]ABW74813.1 hypothetical protein CCC13826_0531 [Campylobacter concisus 13826]